ncbi:insulinase family protein [Zunongwangia sp. H14]|uniref:M16 family metallopeptidase n=1 Tax=Zunongwangia sp. H14 TaxID=3240792 RepID=UPI00356958EF
MMKLYFRIFLLSCTLLIAINSNGQIPKDKSEPDKIDKSIIHGTLRNGFTYYIKPLKGGGEQLKMTFMIKVGSNYEEPHETDFAHHLEHLAFRETINFPEGLKSNSSLLSNLNMSPRDVRGKTGGEVTLYYFDLQKANMEAANTGLKWFKDIANNLDLSRENIDRERGVLLQEYLAGESSRASRDAENQLDNELFPCIKDKGNFITHNKSFPFKDLQHFYKRWYKPDRMAVSIVGKIENVELMEKLVIERFNDLKQNKGSSRQEDCGEKYFNGKNGFAVVKSDSNSLHNAFGKPITINLYFRDPKTWQTRTKWEGVEKRITLELITNIINHRFYEAAEVYNNIVNQFSIHTIERKTKNAGKPESALKINIRTGLGDDVEGVKKTIYILKQLEKYGIKKKELDKAVSDFLHDYDVNPDRNLEYWQEQIKAHFVYKEVLPKEKQLRINNYLKKLSVDEVNNVVTELLSGMPKDIGLIIPEDHSTIFESEKKLRQVIRDAHKKPVSEYNSSPAPDKLLSKKEVGSLEEKNILKVDNEDNTFQEYLLENGVKVVLQPLNGTAGEENMVLHGFKPIGASCLAPELYYSAMFSPSIVENAGLGRFTKFDLKRFYCNSNSLQMGISSYLKFDEAGIKGNVIKGELEEFLQVVYLYFSKPRKDSLAFTDWKKSNLNYTAISINPVNDLIDALNQLSRDYSTLPHASKRTEAIKAVDFEESYKAYNYFFGNAKDYTFIITGNFEKEKILPLLNKYLGNLPVKESIYCNSRHYPLVNKPETISLKMEPSDLYETQNSFYGLVFTALANKPVDWQEELEVKILGMVADRLLFGLRADKNLSLYYFAADGRYNRSLNRFEIKFRYNCVPEELPKIKDSTTQIINELKKGSFPKEVLENVIKELLMRFKQTDQEQPSEKSESLYSLIRYGEEMIDERVRENFLKSFTANQVQNTAERIFQEGSSYELVMENKKE